MPAAWDLDDLGNPRVTPLFLVGGVGDRPRDRVVLLLGDAYQMALNANQETVATKTASQFRSTKKSRIIAALRFSLRPRDDTVRFLGGDVEKLPRTPTF